MTTITAFPPAELHSFFAGAASKVQAHEPEASETDATGFERFFADAASLVEEAAVRQAELDRVEAGPFNLIELINPDENGLSDLLGRLLDPQGGHGQGSSFLRLFLQRLDVALRPHDLALAEVRVHREAPTYTLSTYRRRIDLLIESEGLILGIENKVDAGEQIEQVRDYLDHLVRRTRRAGQRAVLVFLTPNGHRPASLTAQEATAEAVSGRLRCWSYRTDLRAWLEACRAACQAPKVRHFLGDLVTYIDNHLRREMRPQDESEANDEC